MPVMNYVMGAFTLAAGVMFVFQQNQQQSPSVAQQSASEFEGGWLDWINRWVFHPHPPPRYSGLPLFGVIPDVILRARHTLHGQGFHRRYRLEVEAMGHTPGGCQFLANGQGVLTAEWSFDQNFAVDEWLLHRTSRGIQWSSIPLMEIDLEAPAYSSRAQPFPLRATMPLLASSVMVIDSKSGTDDKREMRRMIVEIPDIVPRYQKEGGEIAKISPPLLSLRLLEDSNISKMIIHVEENGKEFGSIPVRVPIAIPSPLYQPVTLSTITLCLFYLLYQIHKA